MANLAINALTAKTPASTDLIPVADPTTGIAGKSTVQQVVTAGIGTVAVTNGGTGTSTGSITGTGALAFTAGGTNQNVTISPSGTGSVILDSIEVRMAGTYSASIIETMPNISSGAWNVGVAGLTAVTTGSYNTSTGWASIGGVFTSSYTSAFGYQAGYKNSLGNLLNNPANCTYIGAICRGQDNYETNTIVIGYDARGKGSNTTVLGNSSTTQTWLGGGELRLPGSTSGYVGLKGAAAAGGTTYTLPSADGTGGQMLSTNGSGTLSWASASASPAGSSGQIQYNNGGSFAGASRLTIQSTGWPSVLDTTSANNTGIGYQVFNSLTSGQTNTCFGSQSLYLITSGSGNSTYGYRAGYNLTSSNYNTAIGRFSLFSATASSGNTAIGNGALYNMNGSGSTYNVGIGGSAANSTTTGYENTSIGSFSGYSNTTGYSNTYVGYYSGISCAFGQNNSCLGNSSTPASTYSTDEITLGNSSIATLRCQVTSITSLSDQRDKINIQPMPSVLSFIASLNPVQFDWWMRDGKKIGVPDYGFIAQELQQAQSSNGFDWAQLVYESNPDKLEASPGKLIPILVKAIQELAAKVAALEAAI